MIGLKQIVSLGIVLLVAVLAPPGAHAQGCSGTTACIVITFPDDKSKKPGTSPEVLRVRKDVREQIGTITFVVAGANVEGKVKFGPCNDGVCRTPLVFGNQEPRAVLNLEHGVPTSYPIGEFLKGCDNECALGDEDCIKKHCRYKYSVVDSDGEYDELDPDVVIDPR